MFQPSLGHLQTLWETDPRQNTIFIVYKIKCCVIDRHTVFLLITYYQKRNFHCCHNLFTSFLIRTINSKIMHEACMVMNFELLSP